MIDRSYNDSRKRRDRVPESVNRISGQKIEARALVISQPQLPENSEESLVHECRWRLQTALAVVKRCL